ncbi:hypothetical protein PHMEG_00040104 [Phytophthora megakarya]|uniref:Short chain dehydrogenase n=1 Tax=Phytophthora megakarya TaxID=4795 RepID=A0A225UEK9_9STRA|nr:hypothetical protein PHMEG_00040104 [Phytophthora megakarya]
MQSRLRLRTLNMINRSLSVGLHDTNIIFVTLNPGYVDTDMNKHQGVLKPSESAELMANIVANLPYRYGTLTHCIVHTSKVYEIDYFFSSWWLRNVVFHSSIDSAVHNFRPFSDQFAHSQ